MPLARLLTALALTGCLVVGLAACSDDPEPRIETDPSPSTSSAASTTTPSPSPTEPVDPREEERAFIESYVEAISAAITSGDPDGFLELSTPTCPNCKVFARNIEDAYKTGGRIEDGRWSVASAQFVGPAPEGGGVVWRVDVQSSRETWRDGSGEVVKVVRAGMQRLVMYLARAGQDIAMADVQYRQS